MVTIKSHCVEILVIVLIKMCNKKTVKGEARKNQLSWVDHDHYFVNGDRASII